MTIGFRERRSSDGWSSDGRHRDYLLLEISSQRAPGPSWEQLSADLVEVGQRKHGLRRATFLARPRYLTLAKPHSCLTMRKACSPRARVRERARLIIRQRALSGRLEVGRRLIR